MNKKKLQENWPYPLWFAHRGGGSWAPENTLKGFIKGQEFGFCAAEFDVKLSSDNQCIVLHDDDIERTSGNAGLAKKMLLNELISMDVSKNHPDFSPAYIPSLEEILQFCQTHEYAVNIEIKPCIDRDIETADIVVRDSLKLWNKGLPPIFSSFSIDSLRLVKNKYPFVFRGLLLEDWLHSDEEVIDLLYELDCVSLHAPEKDLTQERVKKIKEAGYTVLSWTVNDKNRANELISWGVQGIITDTLEIAGLK